MRYEQAEYDDLQAEMKQLEESQPYLAPILRAFGPFLLEKCLWLSQMKGGESKKSINPASLADGIPVSQQRQLFRESDPWGSAGWSAATAVKTGFLRFGADMNIVMQRLRCGGHHFFHLLLNENGEHEQHMALRATELGVDAASLVLFLRYLGRFMLEKKTRDLHAQLSAQAGCWKKGYCPVCGSLPHLATSGENGRRMLHCPDCNYSWSFPRLACPYCNYESPADNALFYVENQVERAAHVCDNCRRYLLNASIISGLRPYNADLLVISLASLAIVIQQRGYQPMVRCEWNDFGLAGPQVTRRLMAAVH
ncbi:MAG: formate dehydrogenase accessory protein FdhE [Desulfofustis sp.]|nr:formate dehydrogenase accessory protein FdhE [Desulfofustis sp.]